MEPSELVKCDQCGSQVDLQDCLFFEGPGSSWWTSCPSCEVLLDPEALLADPTRQQGSLGNR